MALLFESLAVNILAVFLVFFTLLYLYFTRNFNFWKKHGVPYEKPLPFVGNLKEAVLQIMDIGHNLKYIYEKHKDKPYVGFFSFDLPALMACDVDLVKNVLVKDSHNFINRVQTADEAGDPIAARAIFALKGQKWKHIRVGMTPIFTSGKMKKMFYLVDSSAKQLMEYLDMKTVDDMPVQVKDTMARFTTDVIASCAFGIESNSLKSEDAEFWHYMGKLQEFSALKSFAQLAISFAPHFQSFFKLRILQKDLVEFFRTTVWTTVDYRKKNGVDRKDFVDNMLELRRKGEVDSRFKIDGDDFVAQAYAFLIAGFETSSTTLSFALYELALNPEIQSRLREEITQVLTKHNQEVTYDAIQEMKYLDMVVSETLRKYPIVPYLDRMCLSDYELPSPSGKGNVTLKAGTGVYIPVYAMHHDPQYFPEPARFDPERFTEENKHTRPHFAYLPFGEGPRNCIGMRFGLMQTKTGLVKILSHYKVEPCMDTPIKIKFNPRPFLIQSLGEIPLLFHRV